MAHRLYTEIDFHFRKRKHLHLNRRRTHGRSQDCVRGRRGTFRKFSKNYLRKLRKVHYTVSIGRKNAYYRETFAVIWGKLACPSERVQRERQSACALNGHASFSQITAEYELCTHLFITSNYLL